MSFGYGRLYALCTGNKLVSFAIPSYTMTVLSTYAGLSASATVIARGLVYVVCGGDAGQSIMGGIAVFNAQSGSAVQTLNSNDAPFPSKIVYDDVAGLFYIAGYHLTRTQCTCTKCCSRRIPYVVRVHGLVHGVMQWIPWQCDVTDNGERVFHRHSHGCVR